MVDFGHTPPLALEDLLMKHLRQARRDVEARGVHDRLARAGAILAATRAILFPVTATSITALMLFRGSMT
jgi:hypothetical protein